MSAGAFKLPTTFEMAVSPDQAYVAAVGQSVIVTEVNSRKRLGKWHPFSHPSHASFSRSSSLVAVKSTSGEIVVFGIHEQNIRARHRPKDNDEGTAIYFAPNDQSLVDASWSGHIRVRRTVDLQVTAEFVFSDEMITAVSSNRSRDTWLFLHQPKTADDENFASPSYLTVWNWPLVKPLHRITFGLDSIDAAAISPCGERIALVGYSRRKKIAELCVTTVDGRELVTREMALKGSCGVRWAGDGKLLGVFHSKGTFALDSTSLDTRLSCEMQYPSDIAFIDADHTMLVAAGNSVQMFSLRSEDV